MIVAIIVLTGIVDRPLGTVPVLGAVTETHTQALTPHRSSAGNRPVGTLMAPSRRRLLVAIHDDDRPQHSFSAQQASTIDPVLVNRSRDRRADLLDMAISIRWHRGSASDLPPGSV
jgi:hypothetical protein